MKEKKRPRIKTLLYWLSAFLLLLIGGLYVSTFHILPSYIQHQLQSFISNSSSGEYQLSISEIKINLLQKSISFEEVELKSDRKSNSYYYFSARKLQAKNIAVIKFLSESNLALEELEITEPLLESYGTNQQKSEVLDTAELYTVLLPFFNEDLKSISISTINFKNAQISQFKMDVDLQKFSSIKTFDVGIKNFFIDSALLVRHDEYFTADDISLSLQDFNRTLSDSLHYIHVDKLDYSIKRQNITGTNLSLVPVDTTDRNQAYYWVNVPTMKITADNIRGIFDNDTIRLDSLFLNDCDLRIRPPQRAKHINLREIRDFDLYQLIKNDFNLIAVNHLAFIGNRMKIESRSDSSKSFQELNGLKVNVDYFELDSTSNTNPAKILYSDQIKLNIDNYKILLNDEVHQFETSNIYASNKDSIISTEQLRLHAINSSNTLPTVVEMQCDSILLHQIDFAQLYHLRELPLKEIAAYKPTLIINQQNQPAKTTIDESSLLYNFIRDYIKGIYTERVLINDGNITINDKRDARDHGIIKTDFTLDLAGFSLDSASVSSTDKLFFAEDIELNFRDYTMNLADHFHQLQVGELSISSQNKMVAIKDINLQPDNATNAENRLAKLNKSELYRVTIPALNLRNTDIHQAFFNEELRINTLEIINPTIYLEIFSELNQKNKNPNLDEFYELLKNYISQIKVETIRSTGGTINLVSHSRQGKTIDVTNNFNLSLDNFILNDEELGKKRFLFSDYFNLTLKDHLFKLSDNVHHLQVSEINLSSKDSIILINEALLYPDITSDSYKNIPWNLHIDVPQIKLSGFDFEQYFRNNELVVNNLNLSSPQIEIYRHGGQSQGKFNFKDFSVPLPKEINGINIQHSNLNDGQLILYALAELSPVQIASSKLNLKVENVKLNKKEDSPVAQFDFSEILAKMNTLHVSPQNIPYDIKTDSITYSSSDKLLSFYKLDILSNQQEVDQTIQQIQIPELRFEGLDHQKAFEDNQFYSEKILIDNPKFSFRQNRKTSAKNPLLPSLPKDLRVIMNELIADEINIEKADFNYLHDSSTSSFNDVDFTLKNVKLDSTRSQNPLGAENLLITLNDYSCQDKNQYYNLNTKRISYTSDGNKLSISNFEIDPIYTKEGFQQVIPYQTDYYSGKVGNIEIKGIDLNSWLTGEGYTGQQISVENANVKIYRDQRTPFNENQYRALPQKTLRDFSVPIYFDSLNVTNSYVSYTEQTDESPNPGTVYFSNMNGKIQPVSNLPQEDEAILSASARFMNASDLNVDMVFKLKSANDQFSVSGSLSSFDLTALNPVTEDNARINIRSGIANRFEFEFDADSIRSEGKLRFTYEDLKISILEQKNGNIKTNKFASFLANNLMFRSKTPRAKILLPDPMYYERDPKKSIINYWWKTIFSGAKNTLGIEE